MCYVKVYFIGSAVNSQFICCGLPAAANLYYTLCYCMLCFTDVGCIYSSSAVNFFVIESHINHTAQNAAKTCSYAMYFCQ